MWKLKVEQKETTMEKIIWNKMHSITPFCPSNPVKVSLCQSGAHIRKYSFWVFVLFFVFETGSCYVISCVCAGTNADSYVWTLYLIWGRITLHSALYSKLASLPTFGYLWLLSAVEVLGLQMFILCTWLVLMFAQQTVLLSHF